MEPAIAIDIGRNAVLMVLVISAPMLLGGLVVGLMVGIFQAVTQIHEMTLTFIPKILVMVGMLMALLPWMVIRVMDFSIQLFDLIPVIAG